jgi:hypothetical protein
LFLAQSLSVECITLVHLFSVSRTRDTVVVQAYSLQSKLMGAGGLSLCPLFDAINQLLKGNGTVTAAKQWLLLAIEIEQLSLNFGL